LCRTRESQAGRQDKVVCGSVVLVRIRIRGGIIHSGGLMLVETITPPGIGSGGRRVVRGERR